MKLLEHNKNGCPQISVRCMGVRECIPLTREYYVREAIPSQHDLIKIYSILANQ